MKRIAFFQDNLDVGGIQKSIVNLLMNFDYTDCLDELIRDGICALGLVLEDTAAGARLRMGD